MNPITVGLVTGDPAGVGPELCAKLIAAKQGRDAARIVVFGSATSLEEGMRVAGIDDFDIPRISRVAQKDSQPPVALLATRGDRRVEPGKAGTAGGAETLEALEAATAEADRLDAIVYAPLNKQAMWMAGHEAIDELHFFADRLGVDGFTCELNKQGKLWTSRVTSHIPLVDVSKAITVESVIAATELGAHAAAAVNGRPARIAVAGLNPHMGEGGAMGREELDVLMPAIEELQARGFEMAGLFPADTVFLRVGAERIDLIVTMFHDQGQIALKALGFGGTSTVLGGLPLPVVTASQGTAYDIVGQNRADPSGMIVAFDLACQLAMNMQANAWMRS